MLQFDTLVFQHVAITVFSQLQKIDALTCYNIFGGKFYSISKNLILNQTVCSCISDTKLEDE